MGKINVLSKHTVDQIAAGEVIERPKSVVKELVENAIDAGATSISVETKNGGIDLIRVTDNGPGIEKEDVPTAFLSHATSKIRDASDLTGILSLGFRGEALSSIASVSEVQTFTKTRDDLTGTSYLIRGGEEISEEEVGTPDGTTMIVRELFYNTPARRKFLKSPMTENSYVGDLLEKCALSHPEIRFKWTSNGLIRLSTSGNGNVKDLIYSIFGRETTDSLLEVSYDKGGIRINGYVGKPETARGSRSFENYFVNGRFVKSRIIDKALEDGFHPLLMQHRYPFAVLYLELDPESYDVNVHPTKLELRFRSDSEIYDAVQEAVKEAIRGKELIPDAVKKEEEKREAVYSALEPFERPMNPPREERPEKPVFTPHVELPKDESSVRPSVKETGIPFEKETLYQSFRENKPLQSVHEETDYGATDEKGQITFGDTLISKAKEHQYRVIGQAFDTYWFIESGDTVYIMDQHAAHEKVLFNRNLEAYNNRRISSQMIAPPVVVTVTEQEERILNSNAQVFEDFGYEIRPFGRKEYAIYAVPQDLYGLNVKEVFHEIMGGLSDNSKNLSGGSIHLKLATISCKAAVKGNERISEQEAEALIKELLTLPDPYTCPHGRPTMIAVKKTDFEKSFKRIV